MKTTEKTKARELRQKGYSFKEIAKYLSVSKSSVSVWVRDIRIGQIHKQRLKRLNTNRGVIERRRATRLFNEDTRRKSIIAQAKSHPMTMDVNAMRMIGAALYWAEGGKSPRGLVRFSNSDPKMIKLMMRFFREVCSVPENKFRGYIHLAPQLNTEGAENFWSDISRIPLRQFFKTYNKTNKSSQYKRDTLPYGTFDIYICDTKLFLTIQGWIEKIVEIANST